MSDSSALLQLVLLWLAVGVALLLYLMAQRAGTVEREEGLPRSRYRFPAIVGAVTAVVCLAIVSSIPFGSLPMSSTPQDQVRTTKDAEARVKLERERAELRKKLEEVEKALKAIPKGSTRGDQTDGVVAEPVSRAWPWLSDNYRLLALMLGVVLLLVGLVVVIFSTDAVVLLRFLSFRGQRSDLRIAAVATLNRLAAAAEQGRYCEGLELGNGLDGNRLDPFDRLDHLYFTSYCAVQLATDSETTHRDRETYVAQAVRDLTTLLDEAPNRGEASYLLGLAQGIAGENHKSLDCFQDAEKLLPTSLDLPFAHNRSVCLIHLAEERLGAGDAEGSSPLFDEVTRLNVLVDQIPTSLVKVRLLNVRRNLQEENLSAARSGLEVVRSLHGLNEAQQQTVQVVCDALAALISVRGGDDREIDNLLDNFVKSHMPPDLPEPDDTIADEYLDSPLEEVDLPVGSQIYRAFFFLRAERTARRLADRGRALTPTDVQEVAKPLRRVLQFELRQRDALAALGGLYCFFVPERRRDGLRWVEAAVSMGSESRVARRLLDRQRRIDVENQEALDWFGSTAARFLHDPSVNEQVRLTLIEELGRFQEFQPMLLDADLSVEGEAPEPTLSLVRERSAYLEKMVEDFATRKRTAIDAEFDELRREYSGLVETFGTALGRMTEVERRLIQAIGRTVLS